MTFVGQIHYFAEIPKDNILADFIEETPDKVKQADLPAPYHFRQYQCIDNDIHQRWYVDTLSHPYIRLSTKLDKIDILYSDFELPLALLDWLANHDSERAHWMQSVNIQSQKATGLTFPISELSKRVQDFNPADLYITNARDNQKRFTPIGYQKQFETLSTRIEHTCQSGVVVGLDDNIGTIRDVAAYHQYLEAVRQGKLKKYEYAITTAQIIDAYAHQQMKEYNIESARRTKNYQKYPVGYSYQQFPRGPIDLSGAYKNIKEIAEQHLKLNEDITTALKTEFNLTTVPGLNTIHQVANLPGQYGKEFENIAKVQALFIEKGNNLVRLSHLLALLDKEKLPDYANALCLYLHGMLWGINQTPYGRKILLEATRTATENPSQKTADFVKQIEKLAEDKDNAPTAIKTLSTTLGLFSKMTGILANISNLTALNLYSFDHTVSVLATEVSLTCLQRKAGKTIRWEESTVLTEIKTIYRGKGITQQTQTEVTLEALNEMRQEHSVNAMQDGKHLSASKRHAFYKEAPKSSIVLPEERIITTNKLLINDESYQLFNTASDKLSGASALFGLSSILQYGQENTAKTLAGQIANDPTLNTALALAEYLKPASPITRKICEETGKLLIIETKTGAEFISKGAALRASLLNYSTALGAIGIILEIANGYEAYYAGDDLALLGAASRGVGATIVTFAPSLELTALFGAVSITTIMGIGFALILVGIALSLLTKSDIEKWIYHGFWGNSEKYWGKAVSEFKWEGNRYKNFKEDIFEQSVFKLLQHGDEYLIDTNSNTYQYYVKEMQRFFRFSDKPLVTLIDNLTLKVQYNGLLNDAIVQEIRFEKLLLKLAGGSLRNYDAAQQANQPNNVKKTFVHVGEATLVLQAEKWTVQYKEVVYTKGRGTLLYYETKEKTVEQRQVLSIQDASLKLPEYPKAVELELSNNQK